MPSLRHLYRKAHSFVPACPFCKNTHRLRIPPPHLRIQATQEGDTPRPPRPFPTKLPVMDQLESIDGTRAKTMATASASASKRTPPTGLERSGGGASHHFNRFGSPPFSEASPATTLDNGTSSSSTSSSSSSNSNNNNNSFFAACPPRPNHPSTAVGSSSSSAGAPGLRLRFLEKTFRAVGESSSCGGGGADEVSEARGAGAGDGAAAAARRDSKARSPRIPNRMLLSVVL